MIAYRGLPLSIVDLSGIFHRMDPDLPDAPGESERRLEAHARAMADLRSIESGELAVAWAGHSSLFFVTKRTGWAS